MPSHVSLTQRDIAIISFVYSYGGVALGHIQKRFFSGSRSHTPCSERIGLLAQAGYLERCRLASQSGVGSGKLFLTLGPKASPLLAQLLEIPRSQLKRVRMTSPLFIDHHLAICDFRLSVELATSSSTGLSLQAWAGDGELTLEVSDPLTGAPLWLIPDSSFTLALPDGSEQTFYLEMDRGTLTNRERLKAKLRAYLAREGAPIPVLFVVPDECRQVTLLALAQEQASLLQVDPTIFWFTAKERVTGASVLASSIWQIAGGPAQVALAPLALGSAPPAATVPSTLFASTSLPGYNSTFIGRYEA